MRKQKNGFTKIGFSRAGFAACSHYKECDMGKDPCFYENIDPEVKEYCFCYQRNHSSQGQEIIEVKDEEIDNKIYDQISLF